MIFDSGDTGDVGGYTIANSLRLRKSASASLSRTFGAATSRKTFTLSFWAKRGVLGAQAAVMGSSLASGVREVVGFFGSASGNGDSLHFRDTTGGAYEVTTTGVWCDPSAWYHGVVAFDTTQATASSRVRMYINGVQQTSFAVANYPAQNSDLYLNAAALQAIGQRGDSASYNFDGYLSDVYFIDGQALTPTSFGEFNADNVWVPTKYSGTFGANGFYLPFNDGSNLTNLCLDRSGNGNNWTASGVSLTAGATHDWMVDSPSVNHAVLDPLNPTFTDGSGQYLSAGNLKYTPAGDYSTVRATMPFPTTGKFYVEGLIGATGTPGVGMMLGIIRVDAQAYGTNSYITYNHSGYGYMYDRSGAIYKGSNTNSTIATGLTASSNNDLIGMEFDADAQTVKWFRNDVLLHTLNLSAAPDGFYGNDGKWVFAVSAYGGAASWDVCLGQRPYTYTHSGFKSLCTANLPAVTVTNPRDHHEVITLTKSGNTNFTIPWDATLYDTYFEIKQRNASADWYQIDGLRGYDKILKSNSTAAETTDANVLGVSGTTGTLKSTLPDGTYVVSMWRAGLVSARQWNFDGTMQRAATMSIAAPCVVSLATHGFSDGQAVQFTTTGALPTGVTAGATYYAKSTGTSTFTLHPTEADALAGTNAVNTTGAQSGTHTCEHAARVSANVTAGFSIVLFSGTGANATVGHGHGVPLKMVTAKVRSSAGYSWMVGHASAGWDKYLALNTTAGTTTTSDRWQSTAPTSSVFSIGTDGGVNGNSLQLVTYCHSEVPGYSRFGSFACNASADGPLGYLGFTPKSFELKASTNASNWFDWDAVRSPANPMGLNGEVLFKNSSGAEGSTNHFVDANAGAFKVRTAGGYGYNESGQTTVFMAYAKHPFGGSNVAPAPAR